MFFQLATRGVADAVDGLVEAAAAAVAGPRACRHCGCCGLPGGGAQAPARAKQDGATSNKATDIDVEAGRAAAGLNGSPGPANGAPPLTHKAGDPVQGPRAAAEAGPSRAERAAAALQGFARRHTAWLRPWLPLALNVEQYRSLRKTFGTDLPAALSSKQGEHAAHLGSVFHQTLPDCVMHLPCPQLAVLHAPHLTIARVFAPSASNMICC
jgi:hypothetical protein